MSKASTLPFSCRCGEVAGAVDIAETKPIRIVCYCRDCRAYLRHLGEAATLDEAGGTEIVQTVPARVSFARGKDKLAAVRMTEKGMHRYYAACCGAAVANGAPTPALPFCGVIGERLATPEARDEALGPIRFGAFTGSATGTVPRRPGLIRHALATLRLVVPATVGKDTRTPFFEDGLPVADPRLVAGDDRAAAYA